MTGGLGVSTGTQMRNAGLQSARCPHSCARAPFSTGRSVIRPLQSLRQKSRSCKFGKTSATYTVNRVKYLIYVQSMIARFCFPNLLAPCSHTRSVSFQDFQLRWKPVQSTLQWPLTAINSARSAQQPIAFLCLPHCRMVPRKPHHQRQCQRSHQRYWTGTSNGILCMLART